MSFAIDLYQIVFVVFSSHISDSTLSNGCNDATLWLQKTPQLTSMNPREFMDSVTAFIFLPIYKFKNAEILCFTSDCLEPL